MRPILSLNQLQVGYSGKAILPPVTMEVLPGQLWGIAGSNGCGKSTLLKTLLGLLAPVSGAANHDDSLKIGYVPQRLGIDLNMPARAIDVVRGGVAQGWSFMQPLSVHRAKKNIEKAMAQTRIHGIARQQIAELSEGQKQRVLMARALVSEPNLLVLDEPTSAMDPQTESEMLELLEALRTQREISVILVSHNLMGMATVATHGLLLDREHQLIIQGDIREVAVHHEIHEHFGRLIRTVVEERFGALPDPEECHDCDH